MVQLRPFAIVRPERVMLLLPATAVTVPPPQLLKSPFGLATMIPDGRASVNLTLVRLDPVVFSKLKIS